MPSGPSGQKRPADAVGCAVKVAKIATGEIVELPQKPSDKRKSGQAGAEARKKALTGEERSAIAKKAASVRWRG